MAVTNNATVMVDFESGGPTYTSIGGGAGASNNTDIYVAGSQSGGRRVDNASATGFWSRPATTYDISGTGRHVKFYVWVTHYPQLTALSVRIGADTTNYETHTFTVAEYPALGGWVPIWVEVGAGTDTGTPSFTAADEFAVVISIGDVGGNASNLIVDQIHHCVRPVMTWDGATGTFASFASTDLSAALGTLTLLNGVYFLTGNVKIGSANSTTFTDSGGVIIAPEYSHLPTGTTWQGIDIDLQHASTVVTWTDYVYAASDPTGAARRPDLIVTGTSGSADLSRNRFDGLRIIDLTSKVTMKNAVIANSGRIDATTAGSTGPDLRGTVVQDSIVAANASALIWNVNDDTDGLLDDMSFDRGTNAHHAIELGTSSPTEVTLRGLVSTGFHASNAQNDSFFHVKRTSGDVTINVVGGTGNFSYKTDGANVTVVLDPVTTTVTVLTPSGTPLQSARVLVEAGNGSGDLPFEESVTITRSGTTATVSHTGHGMSNGDKVAIRGVVQPEYRGVFPISNVSANAYDYTVAGSPATPATGTITATGVVVEGLTDANGQVSASRTFTVDQPVRGNARKSTAAPYYKLVDFTDTVDSVDGLSKTVQMVADGS